MNKIYKVIWSKVRNCWVVVSELAKGQGKNKSSGATRLLSVLVMATLMTSGVVQVQALTQKEKDEIKNEVKNEVAKYLLDKIAHGGEISGVDATRGPTNFPDAIANRIFYYNDISSKIGEKLKKDGLTLRYFGVRPDYIEPSRDYLERYANKDWTNVDNDGAFGAHSMALGYRAFSEAKHGVAIGRSALAGGSLWKGDYGGDGGVAIGNHAWALGDKSVSVGNAARAVHKGIAIGIQAEAGLDENDNTTDWSTAPGFTPKQGKSIQYDPKTKLPYVTSDIRDKMGAIAIGIDAKAHGNHSTAMGVGAKAKSRYAWSFGYSSEASGVGSIAFGSRATAKGTNAIAIGSGNYDQPNGGAQAYSGDTIAIGRGSVAGNEEDTATTYNTVAVGREARAYGKNSIALGGTANVGDIWQKQLADGGTAIGSSSNAALENATAIGYKSIAYGKDAVTLGANTRADIDGGVALGSDSNVGSYASPSYGKAGKVGYDPLGTDADETSTWKATKAAVSVGNQQKDITRQIINVAAGTDNTDAVNVAQLKTLGRKAWKDLAEAKDQLGARIATNTTSITALSGKVRTNTQDIGRLKTDVSTNDTRIRYLYDNMPFMHYVSVKSNGSAPNEGNYKNDGAKAEASIAIGAHTASDGDSAVALGAHSFARGQDSVIVGAASYNFTGGEPVKEGQFDQSIILGSNNTIFAQSAENGGREDKIIGNMNRVEESHGTFVRGTGNMVYDAYNDEALTDEDKQKEQDFLDPIDGGDPKGLFQKGRSHVSVEGDGNLVSGSLYTQVSGVGNHLSNTDYEDERPSTPKLSYNIVTGNRNSVIDSSHNLIMGDNHELENVNGNIIIGSQKAKRKTEKSNVTILGNDANVSVEGGVALGTGSVASTAAGALGYISLNPEKGKTIEDGYKAMGAGDAYEYHAPRLLERAKSYEKRVHEYEEAVKKYEQETDAGKKRNLERTVHRAKSSMERALKAKQESEEAVSLEAAWKSTQGAVSVGGYTVDSDGIKRLETRQITGVAAGTKDSDAVNVAQLKASTTRYFSVNEVTPKTTFKSSFPYTRLDEWGYSVHGNQINDGAKGEGAVAVGENAEALQKYGSAFGYGAKAKQEQSLALGLRAEAEGSGSVAMGGFSIVEQTGKNSLALGQHSRVTAANSVALGAESFVGTLDGIKTDAYLTGDKDKFTADNGVVSVGRTGYKKWTKTWTFDDATKAHKELLNEVEVPDSYRRIVNVAGGAADTDAVNVAQLKAARTTVEAGDYVTVTSAKKEGVDGTVYTVKGPNLTSVDTNLTVTDEEETVAGTTDKKKVGYKLELSKTLTGLESVSSKVFNAGNNVTLGETGLTITGGPSVTTTGIDANNTTITNVAAGAADGDAVNFKQLSDVKTKVEANEGNITTNKNAIADLTPKVTTNTANIGKLQAGFTVKDGGAGKADVTLGGDTKQEVTFKAAVDKTTQATENGSSLTSTVDTDRNVTYSLNMKQLKKDLGITEGTDGVMSSWKLQAKGDTTPQDIKNGEAVTFDVATADKGLTVTRDGKTIKYGIEGSKIDIANNQSITNLGKRIDNLPSIHYFSVKSDDSANPDGTNWKNDGATGKNAIAIGKDAKAERESSVVIGLKASSGVAANDGVAVGSSASVTGFGGVAIGRESSAEGQETVAIGTGAKGVIHRTVAIGGYANADGFGAVAIGRDSSSKERGVSVGTKSFSNYRGVAVGETSIAEAPYAVAVGDLTGAYAMGAVTLGNKTRAFGDSSVAIGNQARVSGKGITPEEYKALPEADQKLYRLYEAVYHNYDDPSKPIVDRKYYKVIDAHDWRAENHYNSIAIGTTSFVEAKEAIGIGAGTRINGDRGVALGYAAVSEEKGTALGAGAQAKANAGVALGEGAVADTAAEAAGYDPKTGKASTETTPTWKSVKGAVSVGTADATRQITNLAAGLADTDAVNVAQLKAARSTVEAGDYVTVTSANKEGVDGTVYTVTGPKLTIDGGNLAVADVEEPIEGTTNKRKTGYKLSLNKELTGLTSVDSTTFKAGSDVTLGETGLTITNGPSVIATGINAGSKKITNVTAGAADGDAVNFKQLKDVDSKVTTNTGDIATLKKGWTLEDGNAKKGTKTVKAEDTVKVTGDNYITATVNNDGLSLAMNETKLNTQINNQINNSTTVINKMNSWVLKAASDKDAEKAGKTINNTDNDVTFDVEAGQGLTVARDGATIKYGVDKAKLAKHITGDVITNINDGSTGVTNISAKFSVTDGTNTKAVNLGKDKNNNVKFLGTAGETTVTVGGNDDAPTVTVGLDSAFKKQVTDNTTNIGKNTEAIGKNTEAIGKNTEAIGKNTEAIGKNTENIGKNTEAIGKNTENIGKNTTAIGENTEKIKQNATDIAAKMTSWNLKAGGVDGEAEIKDGNAVTFDVGAKDQGLTVTRDGSTIKYGIEGSKIDISENKTVKELREEAKKHTSVKAGDYVTVDEGTNEAGGKEYTVTGPKVKAAQGETNLVVGDITKDGKKVGYEISLNKDISVDNVTVKKKLTAETVNTDTVSAKTVKASNKITVGEGDTVTIDKDGLTIKIKDGSSIKDGPSVTTKGIDAGEKKITNVAAGDVSGNSTDVVNGGQLFGVEQKVNINSRNISILGGEVSELNTRVKRVGAGAAALAALHPLDFDPDDKWDFAAGYGNYRGANATSLGAYYRPNEDTMFSIGGSFGGGDNMVNAGVAVKLGQGNHVTTSRVAMAKEIKDLRAEVEVLRQAMTGMSQGKALDPVKMKLFPDIEKNHWAYEAVDKLLQQGVLEGYPDGTFKGDRMMTRYEFAVLVYKAMQRGMNVDERLLQEFEPELERFRIDVIAKDKAGHPTIERVRVNQSARTSKQVH